MKHFNRSENRVVYDIGKGARIISALIFLVTFAVSAAFLAKNHEEIAGLPAYSVRNPIAGLVIVVGAGLCCWIVFLGLWIPIRSSIFPRVVTGKIAKFSVDEDPHGRRWINILIGGHSIKARYNPVLLNAFQSLTPDQPAKILLGSRGLVTRVQSMEA